MEMYEIYNGSLQGGGSTSDIFHGSSFIHNEYIMSPFTSILNFKLSNFHSFLTSSAKIPTQYTQCGGC